MGNNKREIQDTMSAIDGTIHDLEERIAQLRGMEIRQTGCCHLRLRRN